MKNITKILALVMVLAMVLCMAACTTGEPEPTTEAPSTNPTTRPTVGDTEPTGEPDDGKVDYVIIVKDSEGNPVSGVTVNVCLEGGMCFMPCITDENGSAITRLEESSDYYGSVTSDPSTKVYFEDKFEVTIVWDAAEAE